MLHGGDIYGTGEKLGIACDEVIDFSANISPLGMPSAVRQAVIDELDAAEHYPDVYHRRLQRAIGEKLSKLSVTPDMILCGSGAADIIYRFVYALKPRRALVIHPTFVEYEAAMACVGTEIVSYRLNHEDFSIREDIFNVMTEGIDVVFVCNPNNPTGVLTSRGLLLKMARRAKAIGARMVVDEWFLDFVSDSEAYTMLPYLKDFENVLVLRSFTKMFAMPGLRLGYGVCSDTDFLKKTAQFGQSWSVSTTAEAAGLSALKENDYEKAVIAYVHKERAWLYGQLERLGISYIKSCANYILIHVPMVGNLYEKLLKHKIMIRQCENYVNLDESYYRIAVNDHDKNERLISALEKIIKGDSV